MIAIIQYFGIVRLPISLKLFTNNAEETYMIKLFLTGSLHVNDEHYTIFINES